VPGVTPAIHLAAHRSIARHRRMASAAWIRHSRLVRRSASKLALVVGGAVLLALAIGLVQLTRSVRDAPSPAPAPAAAPSAAPAAPAAPAPAPGRTSAARERPAIPSAPSHGAAPPRQPELAIAPRLGFSRDLKRDANGHLVPVITMKELRAQVDRTDAPMKACIARSGQRPTGKATLGFTVAPMNGQLAIESTGVLDDDTLAAYPELVECLHRSAFALVVDGKPIPELGTPIYVRRHVRLENGELVENTFFDFSYNP
jgi:hypothetical protein